MSLTSKIQLGSFVAMLRIHGDELLVLTGAAVGKKYKGQFSVEADLTFSEALGPDSRMQDVVRFVPPGPAFIPGDKFDAKGVKWTVLRRKDNAGDVTVDYWLEQEKTA